MAAKRPKRTAKKKTSTRKTASRKAKKPAASGSDKVEQIQRLIAVMVEAGAVEVELEEAGAKLRVRLKEEVPPMAYAAPQALAVPSPGAPAAPAPNPVVAASDQAVSEAPPGTEIFKSPMLGTFYRAPSPEAEAFVEVGERVEPERTLCIIEAMKVMNEIKAEHEMEIIDILVQNGDPVEYGQPLFVIKA